MAKGYLILDAGHAYNTPGKRNTVASPDFFEWKFNNDVCHKLKKRAEAHDIEVYLTNPNPNKVSDISLTRRANLASTKFKAWGRPSNCLFVSLHGNASYGAWSTPRGVEVYYASNASTKSKSAALLLTNQIYEDMKKIDSKFQNRGRKCADFTVIYKTICPAVLIEHAFYDNKADLNLMTNHIDHFVEADLKAICKHLGIKYKPPVTNPVKPPASAFKPYLVKIIYTGKDGINVRVKADFDSKVVTTVYKDNVFTIVDEKNGMGKLKSGVGWITLNSKYVKKL